VTIASVLGTGILGLPVKTSESGFYPFLCVFVLVLLFELAIIAYFVDLLQQTRAITRLGITSLEQLKARMEDELTKPPAGLALPDATLPMTALSRQGPTLFCWSLPGPSL